ncbi:MAG: hypothetical protein WAW37_17990 [Syntrophobacteraceae bacterium]
MNNQFNIRLTEDERREPRRLVESGRASARKITHARPLMLADRPVKPELVGALSHKGRRKFLTKRVEAASEKDAVHQSNNAGASLARRLRVRRHRRPHFVYRS